MLTYIRGAVPKYRNYGAVAEQGVLFITPEANAIPRRYDPFEDSEGLLLDVVRAGAAVADCDAFMDYCLSKKILSLEDVAFWRCGDFFAPNPKKVGPLVDILLDFVYRYGLPAWEPGSSVLTTYPARYGNRAMAIRQDGEDNDISHALHYELTQRACMRSKSGAHIELFKNTVGEWLDTWVGTYAQFSVKPYTLGAYQRICHNYLTPALGTLRLSELSAPHIQRFYNSLLMERGLSPKTVRNIHGVLHRALEQAMRLGMLRNNLSELCDHPKTRRKEIHPMEQDKIEAFLQAIKGCKYELLYLVTLFTGLRQGEVLGLTWDCVEFSHNTLYINKQLQKTKKVGGEYTLAPTKNSRARVITAASSVLALLKRQKSQQAQAQLLAGSGWDNRWGLVFTNELGGHLTHFTVYKHFKEAVRAIGLDEERFHDGSVIITLNRQSLGTSEVALI